MSLLVTQQAAAIPSQAARGRGSNQACFGQPPADGTSAVAGGLT